MTEDVEFLRRSIREKEILYSKALLERREGDPLLTWEPTKDQAPFVESVMEGKKPENWYFGSNRSGKSDAGSYCGSKLARFGIPDAERKWVGAKGTGIETKSNATAGLVSGISFGSLRDTVQPKYFDNGFVPGSQTHAPFIPPHEIPKGGWRSSDKVLKLKNGSMIAFHSADAGRNAYAGGEYDWIHLDEEHPKEIYNEVGIRVGGRKLRLFSTVTLLPPEGQAGGINWAYQDIVVPHRQGKLPHIGLFTGSPYNNPHISREEIAILESRYPEGSMQRRIRMNGELIAGLAGAVVYAAFDPALHVQPQPELTVHRPIAWCWDFNVEPLITLVGQRDGGMFRVKREFVMESGNIADMCQLFYDAFPGDRGEVWIYGDATSQRRSANVGVSDYTTILNYMRRFGLVVRLKLPLQNPPVRDRIAAMNQALKDEH